MSASHYLNLIKVLARRIEDTQIPAIEQLAERAADSIAAGGILHLFGSGHSHMIAEDAFHRAGGLACVNAMLEESLTELNVGRATRLERLEGYAEVLLTGYNLKPGEIIVVISNSGINAVPIEIAMGCKRRGLHVAALTNIDHSKQVKSRHDSGKRLFEVADEVLDNCGMYGDAEIQLEGLEQKIGPTSTIGGIIVIQTLMTAIVQGLLDRGVTPPVLISANTPEVGEHNKKLMKYYRDRVRYCIYEE